MLTRHAETLFPIATVSTFVLAIPIAWYIAPYLQSQAFSDMRRRAGVRLPEGRAAWHRIRLKKAPRRLESIRSAARKGSDYAATQAVIRALGVGSLAYSTVITRYSDSWRLSGRTGGINCDCQSKAARIFCRRLPRHGPPELGDHRWLASRANSE